MDELKIVGVYTICNTAAICVHEIDHSDDRVLASMNGENSEWSAITEQIRRQHNDPHA